MARSIGEVYVEVEANTRKFVRKVQRDAAISGAFAANKWAKKFSDKLRNEKATGTFWNRMERKGLQSGSKTGYKWAAAFSRLASRAQVRINALENLAGQGTRDGAAYAQAVEAAGKINLRIDAESAPIKRALAAIAAQTEALRARLADMPVDADAKDILKITAALNGAERKAGSLRRALALLDAQRVTVPVDVDVDAPAAKAKAAVAGARHGFSYGRAFVKFAKIAMPTNWLPDRMDSTVRAVIISLVVAGGPLVSLLSSLTAGLVAFGSAIAVAAGGIAVALIPAIGALAVGLGAVAIGFTALADATGELKAFKDAVTSQWKEMQQTVAEPLFAGLQGPVTDAMKAVTPPLRQMAVAMNQVAKEFLAMFNSLDFTAIGNALEPVVKSFGGAFTAGFKAFVDVMVAAAPATKIIGDNLAGVAQSVSHWLNQSANAEKFQEFLTRALDLGSGLMSVFKPFGLALMEIMDVATQGPAQQLLNLFQSLANSFLAWTKSAEGQNALATFFDSISVAVTALEPVFIGLGQALQQMVTPAAAKAVVGIGEALGALLPIVGTLFNSLAESGILDAFTAALVQLVGVLDTSGLMDAIGSLAAAFGQGLAVVLPTVVRLIDGLAQVIVPVADTIGALLVPIMQALAPVIDSVAATLVKLAPKFGELMTSLVLLITPLLEPLSEVLLAVAGNVDLLNPVMDLLLVLLGALAPILVPLVRLLASLMEGVATGIRLFGTIYGKVIELATGFVDWFNSLGPVQATLGLVQTAVGKVTDVIGWLIDKIKEVIDWFGRIEVPDALRTAGDIVGNIGSAIGGALGLAAGGLVTSPTRALIGEAGPEAVIPLARPLWQVDPSVRSLAAMIRGEGGSQFMQVKQHAAGPTVNVYPVQSDPEAVAYSVANRLAVMVG